MRVLTAILALALVGSATAAEPNPKATATAALAMTMPSYRQIDKSPAILPVAIPKACDCDGPPCECGDKCKCVKAAAAVDKAILSLAEKKGGPNPNPCISHCGYWWTWDGYKWVQDRKSVV